MDSQFTNIDEANTHVLNCVDSVSAQEMVADIDIDNIKAEIVSILRNHGYDIQIYGSYNMLFAVFQIIDRWWSSGIVQLLPGAKFVRAQRESIFLSTDSRRTF